MRDRKSHTATPSTDPAPEDFREPLEDTVSPAGTEIPAIEPDMETVTPPTPETALLQELEEVKRALAEQTERHLRVLAEYDNYRRRNQAERARWHREAQEEVVLGMLPVKDDLERMVSQSTAALTLESLLNGLKLVTGKLERSLEQIGVSRVDSQDQPFDPELHDALTTASDPSKADGAVLFEHLKGYRMGDRVIRHAQVVVNRLEEPSDPTPETSEEN